MNGTRSVSQGRFTGRLLARVVSALAAAALVIVLLPRAAGVSLVDIRGAFGTLTARELLVLTLLWAAGLLAHSFVLTGALPGLSRRRALTLSLTGSAIANVLPLGGAAGISLNYAMVRRWRLSAAAFAAFTVVTNAWDVALKLILPAAALAALLVTHAPVVDGLRTLVGSTVVVLSILIALLGVVVTRDRAAARVASIWSRAIARAARLVGRRVDPQLLTGGFLDARLRVIGLVAERWAQLSVGMFGYAVLQATLLGACVAAVGDHLSATQVIVGYAVDRILTLAVLTPGAAGITEAGTAAALVAVGGSPTAVAAGVLLYRLFTFAIEIPVGGVWLGGWMWRRRRTEGAVA